MSSGNQVKRIVTHAEPIPEELKPLSTDLSTIYASERKVEKELPLNLFVPSTFKQSNGREQYSSDFLRIYGQPSIFHPHCCGVKSRLLVFIFNSKKKHILKTWSWKQRITISEWLQATNRMER